MLPTPQYCNVLLIDCIATLLLLDNNVSIAQNYSTVFMLDTNTGVGGPNVPKILALQGEGGV